ncbi:DUF1080 domain-containing protein [Seonamhaeicola marinus]|uniref:DUF1080 domain-containing protein n=2 Tax=Seonamhaeicola marinus TaxID=1912246 RepID=A0A5D0HW12_9FLAO|nr:DUF1080 domain-containing protein [Seonamhaeicola marinus]
MVSAFILSLNTYAQKSFKLFDETLSHFEKWNGVPHTTIQGLPEGTYQSDNVHAGTPLGLNNDIKNVFTMITEDGELVLKITGEIYGGLTTKASYENYHLSVYFKWGDKKWPPRLNVKRDSGILYHCYGDHGRFWKTWKTCLEYQVQETDLGDFIPLGGNTAEPKVPGPKVEIRGTRGEKKGKYDPNSDTYLKKIGYTDAYKEPDAPHGEWNHLEIYVIGNDAVHLVNGEIVMVVENATNPETGAPLTSGQIQIQSEAAECYYKDLTLTSIKKFPKKIRKEVRFK